ncbi:MAG: hypothetical protein ACJ8C4_02325 [Gemmataceae bacterium]
MDACPVIRLSPLVTLCLLVVGASYSLAQQPYPHSNEPPLADPDSAIQLAVAQIPTGGAAMAPGSVPVVTVNVNAPAFVQFNKELTYRIRIENVSSLPALDVHVIHPLKKATLVKAEPDTATKTATELEWPIGALKAGEHKEFTVTVMPQADMSEFNATAYVRFQHGRQAKIRINKPEISLSFNVPKEIQQSDVVTARLEINNPGPTEIKDVKIAVTLEGMTHQYDAPAPGQALDPSHTPQMRRWTIARLGPAELKTLDFRIAGTQPGPAKLTALADSPTARRDASYDVSVQSPRLELTAAGPQRHAANQPAVYRMAVKNAGSFPLRNVTVTDRLPNHTEFVGATDGGQVFDHDVQWVLAVINPGETRSLELTTRHTIPGTVTHQFEAICGDRRTMRQAEVATMFESAQ